MTFGNSSLSRNGFFCRTEEFSMNLRFKVSGMNCAACVSRITGAVTRLPEVKSAAVSLLTGILTVESSANLTPDAVMNAVKAAGYRADPVSSGDPVIPDHSDESRKLKNRLISSLAALVPLLILSWGPAWLRDLPGIPGLLAGVIEGILAGLVLFINSSIIGGGLRAMFRLAPDMNSLVSTGVLAGFFWSCLVLLGMSGLLPGTPILTGPGSGLFFESSAMILTLVTLGRLLESGTRDKTLRALRGLVSMNPETARVVRNGREITVPAASLSPGDIFIVRPGERIPADGTVLSGTASVSESALTGESLPAFREPGSPVRAATLSMDGCLTCRAEHTGKDTLFSRIISLLENAQASRAPIGRTADRVAGIFVPAVMLIALITVTVWLLAGTDPGFAIRAAISVLVISCPCALGLATPVSVITGSGVAARHGILFKNAAALENTGRATTVFFDKTGTLTTGNISITGAVPLGNTGISDLLRTVLALEKMSEHPLAKAAVSFSEKMLRETGEFPETPPEVTGFKNTPGLGITAELDGHVLKGGSLRFMKKEVPDLPANLESRLAAGGDSVLIFARDKTLLGYLTAADTLRNGVRELLSGLHKMGIRTIMLTGDHEANARKTALITGISEYRAGLLPEDKAAVIREFSQNCHTIMAGDGINDAVALKTAHTGIAMGSGTAIAIDAADAVILNSDPAALATAIKISRKVLRNIRENLFWAFVYNAAGIPLAAGCFHSWLGWQLNPVFAALAMSLSSISVVGNALRLSLYSPYPGRSRNMNITGIFRNIIAGEPELSENQLLLRISGMKCSHCENAVRKALEALPEITAADVSHKKGRAIITLSREISGECLRAAIAESGFELKEVTGKNGPL